MSSNLILTNGHVHTMDPFQPLATAVAIRDSKIIAVGDDQNIRDLGNENAEWLDLAGRTVIPGLVDAHVHFQGFALARQRVDLDEAVTLAEVLQRIANYAEKLPDYAARSEDVQWLQGRGWAQDAWQDAKFPTAAHLDQIIPHRPVYLSHKSGHAAWVNSTALKIAGITATIADPPGGQIQRDAAGQPTGILFEDAMKLVQQHIPKPSLAEIRSAMLEAQTNSWQVGLTGIHDFDGRSCFQALQELH